MAKFRIAVIGHTGRGNYGHGLDNVWLEFPDRCEIVAVADADEKGRAEGAKRLKVSKTYADYRQMLDEAKPQIVAICPRHLDQHRDMAVAAAERGIHIFTEKPFCRTPAEADQIIAACEKRDVKLTIAHQSRYGPKLQVVREIIDSGQIGKVLEIRGRGKEDQRGGSEDLWVLGCHVFNLINYFGGQPKWCSARVMQNGQPVAKADVKPGNEGIGPLAGDRVDAMFGFDSGITAYFSSQKAMGAGGDGRFAIQIFGSKGIIDYPFGYLPDVQFLADPLWSPGRGKANWVPVSSAGIGKPEPLKDGGLPAGNRLIVQDLFSAIENDRDPECDMYEARTTIEMISAVFESHRTGALATFPLKTRENPLTLL
jgi:predicted dehydrogenase